LDELRQQAVVPVQPASPELVIEALLMAQRLPQERCCVLCQQVTDGTVICQTECSKAYVSDGGPRFSVKFLAYLAFGWSATLPIWGKQRREKECGTDRIYSLPLRVCDACREQLATANAVKAAMRRVPAYADLLEKYPRANISLLHR
jgi:hypothetical protein